MLCWAQDYQVPEPRHVAEQSRGSAPTPELSVVYPLIPAALNALLFSFGAPQNHMSSWSQVQWISAKLPVARFMHPQALLIMALSVIQILLW